jgi:hypothetical protein
MSAHAEASIAAMIVRSTLPRRAAAGLVLAVVVGQLTTIGGVSAADPPAPGPLDRPIADVAVIHGPGPPGTVPPRLLTLDTVDLAQGTVRATVLDRAGPGWQPISAATLVLFESGDGAEAPWLIEIEPGQFAVLVTSHQEGRTAAVPVHVAPESGVPLEIGPTIRIPTAVDDAGAIDVDANGSNELILSAAPSLRGGDACQDSVVRVLDGTTLSERAAWSAPEALAGGVLGEWDGRPGGDLLAYAYGTCGADADTPGRVGVIANRLADGTPIAVQASQSPSVSTESSGVPLAADFDGDGREEVVIRDAGALVVLEPHRGWTRTLIARAEALPLVAAAPESPGLAGTLVWLDHGEADESLVVAMASIERAPDGELAVTATSLDLAGVAPSRRGRVLRAARDLARAQAAPQAWLGHVDGDGCADILAPLLTINCARINATPEVGATWFASRPVVAYQAGDNRELLVAATMDWDPTVGLPPPTPVAVIPAGAWRHGPSVRFALAEVRAGDAAYFSVFPVPRPTIERAAVRGQATDFPGFTGTRILVRATSARPDDAPPAAAPTLDDFLTNAPSRGELVAVERIPVQPGAESGRDGSFVHMSLADVVGSDGGPAERWTVTIAQVNDWGEIAGPVRGTIIQDTSGPSLVVEAPFLSAPWPMEATVHGRSEPRVEIRGGSAGPVVSDRRGRFELRTQLAPWPQTVELVAIDESGNITIRQFSLVGGVDYRAFPWPAILAAVLLIGAVVSAGRGSRVVNDAPRQADSDPRPEIEELPSAGSWPHA